MTCPEYELISFGWMPDGAAPVKTSCKNGRLSFHLLGVVLCRDREFHGEIAIRSNLMSNFSMEKVRALFIKRVELDLQDADLWKVAA